MGELGLACASDERYAPHSAAMLRSALTHSGRHAVHVHYLVAPEFPAATAERLREMVTRAGGEFSLHRIPASRVRGMPSWEYIGQSMWYRLFLPDLVEADRVLYLDVDTIVADSLEPLWDIDLSGHYLGAVTNVFERHQLHRPRELGLASPARYFNSGVLLMNLDALRRDDCSRTLARFARERASDLLWPDQDALNVVLGDRRLALHPRWNCMNAVLQFPWSEDVFGAQAVAEARKLPGIRHFEGPSENKPWHYLCHAPGRELYAAYRAETPWPRVELEGRTPANVLRRGWARVRTPVRS